MDFQITTSKVFPTIDKSGNVILDSIKDKPADKLTPLLKAAYEVIDKMGEASAKARKAPTSVTDTLKFFSQTPSRLYMRFDGSKCLGYIRIGD